MNSKIALAKNLQQHQLLEQAQVVFDKNKKHTAKAG